MEAKESGTIGKAIQEATAAELAGMLGLAFARLVALAGLPAAGTNGRAAAPRLVSVPQAAQATGMSRRWFYDHREEPFMRRLGRNYRVDLTALEARMAGQP
jgi:hypothetical protein